MASSHIRVRLQQPFLGVSDFHSTNGYASFSEDGDFLLIADACMLIVLNFKEHSAQHCYPPKGWYFKRPYIGGGKVEAGLNSSSGESAGFGPIAFSDSAWESGLGRAVRGILPSVHMPYYQATFR